MTETTKKSKAPYIILGVLAVVLIGSIVGLKYFQVDLNKKKAEKEFGKVYEKIEEDQAKQTAYDLEETIRIINGIDLAMQDQDNFKDYMFYMSRQDYSKVAPEVIEARTQLLKILQELYAKQSTLEKQEALWNVTKEMSEVIIHEFPQAGAEDVATGGISMLGKGMKTAKEAFVKMNQLEKEREILSDEIDVIQNELFQALLDYSDVYYKYVNQWDEVCVNRDMAYLAAYSGNIAEMNRALDKLFQVYPDDKEGQILQIYANLHNMQRIKGVSDTDLANEALLNQIDAFMTRHPKETAPALLLKGVYFSKIGAFDRAKLNFEEASVYYPKQADKLSDMLNSYKMRTYLRKTREGRYIVELYKSTMLGAGYFSPDLQMAKMYFDLQEDKLAKEKVLDHFSRRRNQSHWDYILSDIQFCENNLGVNFLKLFPENSYLDLQADIKTKITSNSDLIEVGVDNRSDIELSNVSLILCIQYTEMHKDDYVTVKMDKTLPKLKANSYNDFGSINNKDVGFWAGTWNSTKYLFSLGNLLFNSGTEKQEAIVKTRAVLISDEAIAWIDEKDFKYTEEIDNSAISADDVVNQVATSREDLQNKIKQSIGLAMENSLIGKDELKLKLPKELAIFKPMFKLYDKNNNQYIKPEKNIIKNDLIELSFKQNFSNSRNLILQMNSFGLNGSIELEGNLEDGYKVKNVSLK